MAGWALLALMSACDAEPQADSTQQQGMGGNTVTTRDTVTSDLLGKVRRTEFERMNQEGLAAMRALKPTPKILIPADQALLREVATAAAGQLAWSQAAAGQLEHPHAVTVAQAEEAEQRVFVAKLTELGQAYQLSLPMTPPAEVQTQLEKLKGLQGRERDVFYLREAGVASHQSLESLMQRLEAQAKDPVLQQLGTLSQPLIRAHLQVSEDVGNELSATALASDQP
ncbi:MAG: DUF4142 domain-containing protein [Candidatus Sericytochromatia bacterium]